MKQIFILSLFLLCLIFILPVFSIADKNLLGTEDFAAAFADTPETDPTTPTEPAPSETSATSAETAPPAPSGDGARSVSLLTGGKIIEISMYDYLVGVVAAEMPAMFPEEALKAQAVAARTITLYNMERRGGASPHPNADVCDDPTHCKAYLSDIELMERWGGGYGEHHEKIARAVSETQGKIVVYEGEPILAVFHAASAGFTENSADVWGGEVPYLRSVDSPGEDQAPDYYSRAEIDPAEFKTKFLAAHPDADFPEDPRRWFMDSHRSASGGIMDVLVGGIRVKGSEVREMLGLRSTNFTVRIELEKMVFRATGYGHGVGMSQYGARAMALDGKSFSEILEHYYPGAKVADE